MTSSYDLQLLFSSDLEGGDASALERAVLFAGAVDELRDGQTLVLSAGDNIIPGPFLSAALDSGTYGALSSAVATIYNNAPLPTGLSYSTLEGLQGSIDMAIMSAIGFDASALGNHELDNGPDEFADLLAYAVGRGGDLENIGPSFPYLSANIDTSASGDINGLVATSDFIDGDTFTPLPTVDVNGAVTAANTDRIAKAAYFDVPDANGVTKRIAIVSAVTPNLPNIGSPGDVVVLGDNGETSYPLAGTQALIDQMAELATVIQPVINAALDDNGGVNADQVILVSHLQEDGRFEKELIKHLKGVNIVLAGGSDKHFINKGTDATINNETEEYFTTTNKEGEAAYVFSVEGKYQSIGQLHIDFAAPAEVDTKQDDVVIADAAQYTVKESVGVQGQAGYVAPSVTRVAADGVGGTALSAVETDPAQFTANGAQDVVNDLIGAVRGVVNTKDAAVLGYTNVYLDGRKPEIRSEETNLGNLVTDAILDTVNSLIKAKPHLFPAGINADGEQRPQLIDAVFTNSGSLRAAIGSIDKDGNGIVNPAKTAAVDGYDKPAGAFTQLDAENSMRYNNRQFRVDLGADDLRTLIEHGVSRSNPGNDPGQFPQVAGMRFSYDWSADFDPDTAGQQRVKSLFLINDDGSVKDVIVQDGKLQGDPDRDIAILAPGPFLALGNGDSYPVVPEGSNSGVAHEMRYVTDQGYADITWTKTGVANAPTGFPGLNFDGSGNATYSTSDPNEFKLLDEADFDDSSMSESSTGVIRERRAVADYLSKLHNSPANGYDKAETSPQNDLRMININDGNMGDDQFDVLPELEQIVAPMSGIDLGGSEFPAYSAEHQIAAVITGGDALKLVDLSNFKAPAFLKEITLDGDAQSVAIHGDLVAVAVAGGRSYSAKDQTTGYATAPGEVSFFRLSGEGAKAELSKLGDVTVGALPDNVVFNEDGTKVLTADEAESINEVDPYNDDAKGSISMIDVSSFDESTVDVSGFTAATVDFSAFVNGHAERLRLQGVRIFPQNTKEAWSDLKDVDVWQEEAQDIEPEAITILGDKAWVSLQENNAVAELDISGSSPVISDIWSLGIKDWTRGTPQATNIDFTIDYPTGATRPDPNGDGNINPEEVTAGGLSGAWYNGQESGLDTFYVITDRGPQANNLPVGATTVGANTNSGTKVFDDPDYPITVYKLSQDGKALNEEAQVQLKVPYIDANDGLTKFRPLTGIGADLPSHDAAWELDSNTGNYVPSSRDAFGLDAEAINVITVAGLNGDKPMFAVSDEYFPQIMLFDEASGNLVKRFVPAGTDFTGGSYDAEKGDVAAFTSATLPAAYADRSANRGFEGMAWNSDTNKLVAFVQSPMSPAGHKNTEFVRVLEFDPAANSGAGQATAEYLHLLSKESQLSGDAMVDKIGDVVYDANTKRYLVIERDSLTTATANKAVLEVDLSRATNVLDYTNEANGKSWQDVLGAGVTQPEMADVPSIADALIDSSAAIKMAHRVELFNLPSIGANFEFDKPEGLALKPDGSLMVFNDNDFTSVAGRADNVATEIVFTEEPIATDKDKDGARGNKNLYGLPMPDGLDSYVSNGQTYIIVAGEGDDRDSDFDGDHKEAKDVEDVDVTYTHTDGEKYGILEHADLSIPNDGLDNKLGISTIDSDYDGDGVIDQPYAFGSRSFRIYDDKGNLVHDSGNLLEEIGWASGLYDSGRTDNKGVEPEMVIVEEIDGRQIAFVGFERLEQKPTDPLNGSAVAMFDVTDPHNTKFLELFANTARQTGTPVTGVNAHEDGDMFAQSLRSEGMVFIPFQNTNSSDAHGILMVAAEGDDIEYNDDEDEVYDGQHLDFYEVKLDTLAPSKIAQEILNNNKGVGGIYNPSGRINLEANGFDLGNDQVILTRLNNNSRIKDLKGGVSIDADDASGIRIEQAAGGLLIDAGQQSVFNLSSDKDEVTNLGGRGNLVRGGFGADAFEVKAGGSGAKDTFLDFQLGVDELTVRTGSSVTTYGNALADQVAERAELLALAGGLGIDFNFTPDLRAAHGKLHAISGTTTLAGAGLRVAKTDSDIVSATIKVSGAVLDDSKLAGLNLTASKNVAGTEISFSPANGHQMLDAEQLQKALGMIRFNGSADGSVEITAEDKFGLVATTTRRDFSLIAPKAASALRKQVVTLDGDNGADIAFTEASADALQVLGTKGGDTVRLSNAIKGRNTSYGFEGADQIFAPKGGKAVGGADDDVLVGSVDGYAILDGGADNDTLIGGTWNSLYAGSGHDTLIAMGSYNRLRGDAGSDKFVLADTHQPAAKGPNTVLDFELGVDKLVLAGDIAKSSAIDFEDTRGGVNMKLDGKHIAYIHGVSTADDLMADVVKEATSYVAPLMNTIEDVKIMHNAIAMG